MIPYMEISNSIASCSGSSVGSFVYDFFCPPQYELYMIWKGRRYQSSWNRTSLYWEKVV